MSTQELTRIDNSTQELAGKSDFYVIDAEGYVCRDRPSFAIGATALRAVKDLQKELEARRVSVTGPLNEALRTINGWFKGPLEKLNQAERAYKGKMAAFEIAEQDRIRKEQIEADRRAREEREELERRALAALEKGNEKKAEELIHRAEEVVPELPETAPIKAAGVSFGTKWDFVVADKDLIPREFLMVDTAKIGQVVRALKNKELAEKQIPGITVFSSAQVSARGAR